MRCAACSKKVEGASRYCDQCGAAQGSVTLLPTGPGDLVSYRRVAAASGNRNRNVGIGAGLLLLVAGAAFGAAALLSPGPVPADQLQAAVREAITEGAGPGSDPICVANGLAYDQTPVNVEPDNTVTVSWMATLVSAGLYEPSEEALPSAPAAPQVLTYRPLPALADWAGPRRLCIARAVRLQRVANIGEVQEMSLRGKRYAGVSADVVWTLDRPASWLANPDVADAFARELPLWRSAKWTPSGKIWRLTQRKHFFRIGNRWVTGETAERLQAAQQGNAAASL
jgi:hypothetical protein